MRVYSEHFPKIGGPFAVCIGKFDGLHIGHRKILDTLLKEARKHSAASAVYSFEPLPGTPRLSSADEKATLFASIGIDILINAELSREFMAQPAELFVWRLAACGKLAVVVVGRDFRFGHGAAGNVALMKKLGRKLGFDVHAIGRVRVKGQQVSSTLIREYVKSGDVERAALLLGREYSLSGEVVKGRQLGEKLGFKTANLLKPAGKLMPANGVYAAYVDVGSESWPAMTNIGTNPTMDGKETTIESHLLGFEGDLYGKKITVRLVKRIREEIRFIDLEQLKKQLDRDKQTVEKLLDRQGYN